MRKSHSITISGLIIAVIIVLLTLSKKPIDQGISKPLLKQEVRANNAEQVTAQQIEKWKQAVIAYDKPNTLGINRDYGNLNWGEVFAALRQLPAGIILTESAWIDNWISQVFSVERANEYHYVRVNELMETLRLKQEYNLEQLYSFYINLAHNDKLHYVLRDYAIQHLCLSFKTSLDSDVQLTQQQQTWITDLLALSKQPHSLETTIAGTTWTGLADISHPQINNSLKIALVHQLGALSSMSTENQTMLISVATNLQILEVNNPIKAILLQQSNPIVTLSAIHTAGQTGNTEYLSILAELQQQRLYKVAATKAIENIRAKN